MTQYIDKSAVVAEIERRKSEVEQIDKASYEVGLLDAYKTILSFLDTLKVKEVVTLDDACKWWEEELSYPTMTADEIKWYKEKVNSFRKAMKNETE